MADFFVDHGCTLYPSAYMSVPASAASLPQEGDGKASGTGAAPAVASASWNLTGASATSGTMTVMGATLTGLTASGSALATAIAAAINASTAAVTTSTGGLASPYLKALVWAVAAGATLTVHARIASADLNQSANASCIMAVGTGWTSPPATANFSGGVSGPWAHFINTAALTATINASIGAAGTYGAVVATMMGNPGAGDVINVRSGRGGADIVLTFVSGVTVNTRSGGNATAYQVWKIDNGVVWSDGSSNGVFTLNKGTGSYTPQVNVFGYTHLLGAMKTGTSVQSGGVPNFKIRYSGSESAAYSIRFSFQTTYGVRHFVADCLETADDGLGTNTISMVEFGIFNPSTVADGTKPCLLRNCKIGHVVRSAASFFCGSSNFGQAYEASDCLFELGNSVVTYSKALLQAYTGTNAVSIKLIRPKFTGGGGGIHAAFPWIPTTSNAGYQLLIEDPVDMGQMIFSSPAASLCGQIAGASGTYFGTNDACFQAITSNSADRKFLWDTPRKLLEWRSAGFPTSGLSTLPDGTPFSVRFSVAPTAVGTGLVTKYAPQRGIRQANVNTLGDQATLYATVRVLIDTNWGGSAYSPLDDEWWVEGTYVSSVDGSTKTFSTRGTGSAVATDTTAWSALTYNPFAAGSRTYARYKFEVALANVEDATEVVAYVVCAKQPSTMNEWAFIDPLVGLST